MNVKDSNELKRGAGYLKEKAIIGLARVTGDELDRAIMKVTSHMLKAPKEKHMQRLLATTYGHYKNDTRDGKSICGHIVAELEKRMHTHNWIVVLKTLVTLHRLMTDGSNEFNACIKRNRSIFCARNLKDLSESVEGAAQALFIRQYLSYLEERAISQEAIGVDNRLESVDFSSYLRSMDVDSLTPFFGALLGQLAALVAVEYQEAIVDNFCTLEAYQRLVCDGKILYQLLSNRVIFVLDGFDDFSLPLKKVWLELYRQYSVVVEKLRLLFDSILRSSKVFMQPPPQLKPLPDSFLGQLEDDVRLSSIPREDVTETLGKLGICGSEIKSPPRETVEKTSPPLSPSVNAQQRSGKESPSIPPVATEKKEAAFSMDELFVSAPAAESGPAVPSAPADPLVDNQYFPLFSPQSEENTGPEKLGDHYAALNTVIDDGWSTGAPVSWEGTPSVQYSTAAPVADGMSHTVWGGTYSSATDAIPKQGNENVFKELYTEEQKGWHANNI
ncbi:clathrin coat assembly protein [Trypanosoma cruzi cruzi]|uniref:Putative clathrin coat assembly protein n=1 Tax=Trypanosoma cruzi TaxID=5693 RepID=A0A2V2VEE7_TRYCR|nr:clathrin coat assembly protein [Trypanosoma cruzi cruzi]PWU93962.1 putative clathrin coat assembly protein [Trypanosoma cruzi]